MQLLLVRFIVSGLLKKTIFYKFLEYHFIELI